MSTSLERYWDFMKRFPAPGGGGAHQGFYSAGCYGVRAKRTADEVIRDIQAYMPSGGRHVSLREIEQGVKQAFADAGRNGGGFRAYSRPRPAVGRGLLDRFVREGHCTTEADIMARSPVDVRGLSPVAMAVHVLNALYADDEMLYMGDDGWRGEVGSTIRSKLDWVKFLRSAGQCPWPKLMLNPVTGKAAPKKSGEGMTYRGDACIASHRYVVVEHDRLSLADQLAFWSRVPRFPVVALVLSGKKSIHAWVRVDCEDADEWERQIEQDLFPRYLTPMGFDPACKNEARLTRMPGHVRKETGQLQRCIYLAPDGKAVCEP